MSEDQLAEEQTEVEEASPAPAAESPPPASTDEDTAPRGWRDLWQIPVAMLGVALIVTGLLVARGTENEDDYAGVLNDAEALIARNSFDDALGLLNGTILPRLDEPAMTPTLDQRFHMLRGDAVSLGQSDRMISNQTNNEMIVREYSQAEQLLADLGPDRHARLAQALIELGRLEEAQRRVAKLPETHADAKRRLTKRLILAYQGRGAPGREKSLELLSTMAQDVTLSPEDRVWALARQAELRLASGFPERALEGLLRAVHRLDKPSAQGVGTLYLLLAEAYHELGRLAEAQEQLERADALLPPQDTRRAKLLTIAGEIDQVQDRLPEARDRFAQVVQDYPQSRSLIRAMLGVAEVDALLGDVAESIAMSERLVDEFRRDPRQTDLTADRIAQSLLEQHQTRLTTKDHLAAIEYARLADRLYPLGQTPPEIILARATAHRLRAERMVEAEGVDPSRPVEIAAIDPVTRAEIRAHFMDAGESFLRHARRTVLSDDLAFTDSLWMAGDSYDLAGETGKTIEIFSEYAGGLDDDPRLPAAIFRLAGAHQSRGDYDVAVELYRGLINDHPNSSEAASSHVRLAQTYMLDDVETNDADAQRLLERILTSGRLEPDAVEYRDALVQLGRIHLRAGRHVQALDTLAEVVERYPEDPERMLVEFQLADAYRLAASEVGERLETQSMPAGRRRDLEAQRERWLRSALALYEDVRTTLDAKDERRRNDLEDLLLRNAHFYRADAAFDLGEYEAAIRHYDAAAQRYSSDPASLVAMVQIVNCYVELDRWQEARTANERARRRLRELPPEALDAPDLPMTRSHWERWLDSAVAIDAVAEAGDG